MGGVRLAAAGVFAVVAQTTVAYAASGSRPAERGRNLGVVTSGVVVGILGARVVTGTLAEVWGWRSVYAVLADCRSGSRPSSSSYCRAVVSLGGLFGQLPRSLWLLIVGIVVFDFAVQAVHVSNQHLLTAARPDRTSSVIGGYMVFYSLGSALGAAATTAISTGNRLNRCCSAAG